MLHVRMRRAPASAPPPAHAIVQVFIGPDKDRLALAGEITLQVGEWDQLRGWMRRWQSEPSWGSPVDFSAEREAADDV